MDDHEIIYIGTAEENGFTLCQGCGWRSEYMPRRKAEALADRHLHHAMTGRLNSGARPSIGSLVQQYRENARNLAYSREERIQWVTLADELEAKLQAKNQQLEGQLEIPFT